MKGVQVVKSLFAASVAIPLLVLIGGCSSSATASSSPTTVSSQSPSATPARSPADTLVYSGANGKTVLELLTSATNGNIQVSGSGANAFVVGINGRIANTSKHEFWALYVNGKFAKEGAGTLETRDGDRIEWRIETY